MTGDNERVGGRCFSFCGNWIAEPDLFALLSVADNLWLSPLFAACAREGKCPAVSPGFSESRRSLLVTARGQFRARPTQVTLHNLRLSEATSTCRGLRLSRPRVAERGFCSVACIRHTARPEKRVQNDVRLKISIW